MTCKGLWSTPQTAPVTKVLSVTTAYESIKLLGKIFDMPHWKTFKGWRPTVDFFQDVAKRINSGSLDLGRRHYAQSLTIGVLQSILCGYDKVVAVELGVASGRGLLDICTAAQFFRDELEIEVLVYGFDNASGLPPPIDHRDHPEMWSQGQFDMTSVGGADALREKLPSFAKLVIGDVGETIPQFEKELNGGRLGFVSLDLDYYSSTRQALKIFEFGRDSYLPAVPFYCDDVSHALTFNPWCGEELAIDEFNQEHDLRKISKKESFVIRHFYVCHVLDHPLRTGEQKCRPNFPIIITRLV
jgi:hypothetical protein